MDLIIAGKFFRVKYFEGHRADALRDARKFAARLGEAIKNDLCGNCSKQF